MLLVAVTPKDLLGRELRDLVLGYGSVTWAAVACLIASGRVLLRISAPPVLQAAEPSP